MRGKREVGRSSSAKRSNELLGALLAAIVVAGVVSAGCASSPEAPDDAATQGAASGEEAGEAEPAGEQLEIPLERGSTEGDAEIDELVETLGGAVERAMSGLSDRKFPPYFISFLATEIRRNSVSASFGAVERARDSHRRILDTDVRIGSYQLDNTHKMRGQMRRRHQSSHSTGFPLESGPPSAKSLWKATENQYRSAEERYKKVRANESITVESEIESGDFTERDPVKHFEETEQLKADLEAWKKRARTLSDVFSDYDVLEVGNVRFREEVQTRYLADAEGSRVRKVRHTARVSWFAMTTADDGMKLRLYNSVEAFDPDDLPPVEKLESRIRTLAGRLVELREAPRAEPFVGPAILEGEAAGVFFHEALGHRVEGHRQIDESEGQTFREKVGEQVLPRFLDVYDDPRLVRLGETPLMGHYRIDDEAVPSQRATIVEGGILKGFLMARQPFGEFQRSNGHGRRQAGKRIVARQGNLIAHPRETVSRSELKEKLLDEIEKQDKPYGLRFVRVQGGFTLTQRFFPQSFRVLPLLVYRVYPDGEEELVRGVTLEGTPLTALSNIAAAADDVEVFNGMCGAESGRVPVSSVSPTLLVDRMETARSQKGSERPPILPPPSTEKGEDDGDE